MVHRSASRARLVSLSLRQLVSTVIRVAQDLLSLDVVLVPHHPLQTAPTLFFLFQSVLMIDGFARLLSFFFELPYDPFSRREPTHHINSLSPPPHTPLSLSSNRRRLCACNQSATHTKTSQKRQFTLTFVNHKGAEDHRPGKCRKGKKTEKKHKNMKCPSFACADFEALHHRISGSHTHIQHSPSSNVHTQNPSHTQHTHAAEPDSPEDEICADRDENTFFLLFCH